MCCISPNACIDEYSDPRRFREEVIRMLRCINTSNPDNEYLVLCDVQPEPSEEVFTFIRRITRNCDGSTTVNDFEMDAITPYTVTGEVTLCSCIGNLDCTYFTGV